MGGSASERFEADLPSRLESFPTEGAEDRGLIHPAKTSGRLHLTDRQIKHSLSRDPEEGVRWHGHGIFEILAARSELSRSVQEGELYVLVLSVK